MSILFRYFGCNCGIAFILEFAQTFNMLQRFKRKQYTLFIVFFYTCPNFDLLDLSGSSLSAALADFYHAAKFIIIYSYYPPLQTSSFLNIILLLHPLIENYIVFNHTDIALYLQCLFICSDFYL